VIKAAATFDLDRFNFRNVPAFIAKAETKTMKRKITAGAQSDEDEGKELNGGVATEEPTTKPIETDEPKPPTTQPKPAPPTPPPKPPDDDAAASYERGVQAERQRVLALQKLDRAATHDIVTKAIAEGKMAADVIEEIVAAMDKASAQAARRADASALNDVPPSDGTEGKQTSEFGALIKKHIDARAQRGGVQRMRATGRN
jgi:hypothetical protein